MDSSWGAFGLMAGYCKGVSICKIKFSHNDLSKSPLDFVDLEAFGA
jgi:hypothetical protein